MVTNVLKILFILQVIKLIWYPNISGWEEGYMYLLCGWILNTFQHSGAVFASIINAVNCLCFYKR